MVVAMQRLFQQDSYVKLFDQDSGKDREILPLRSVLGVREFCLPVATGDKREGLIKLSRQSKGQKT
jgi:hypothetical protein